MKTNSKFISLRSAGLATALGICGVVAGLVLAGPGAASSAAVNHKQDGIRTVITPQPTSGVPKNVIPGKPIPLGTVPGGSVSGGTTSAAPVASPSASIVPTLQPTSGVPTNAIPGKPIALGTVPGGSVSGGTTSANPGANG